MHMPKECSESALPAGFPVSTAVQQVALRLYHLVPSNIDLDRVRVQHIQGRLFHSGKIYDVKVQSSSSGT